MKIGAFELERWYARHAAMVRYDLSESCAKVMRLSDLASQYCHVNQNMPDLHLDYGNGQGGIALRQEIGRRHGVSPECILVTVGAIEAIYLVMNALLRRDDTVVTEYPVFQPLYSIPKAVGAQIKFWELHEEEAWQPSIAELHRLVDNRTRLIVINHPHNPTGASLDLSTLKEIVEIAQEYGAYVLSNEVARDLVLFQDSALPPAATLADNAISIGSMSKAYGLPGLRVGWILAASSTVEQCLMFRDYITVCNATLSEYLATVALKNHEAILQRNLDTARTNYAILKAWGERNSAYLEWIPPKGGVTVFPRYHLDVPSAEFCQGLLQEKKVLLLPGEVYDVENHFRLGFGGDTEILSTGLRLLEEYVQALAPRNE